MNTWAHTPRGILLTFLVCLLGFSLSAQKIPVKNIGFKYDIRWDYFGTCTKEIYSHPKTSEKLNGRYRLKYTRWVTLIADFKDGMFHGQVKRLLRNKLYEEATYDEGEKHGLCKTFNKRHFWEPAGKSVRCMEVSSYEYGSRTGPYEVYKGKQLIRKGYYSWDRKNKKEYVFGKEGDTLEVFTYAFDYQYDKPELKKLEIPNFDLYEYKGQIEIDSENYYNEFDAPWVLFPDLVYIDSDCDAYQVYVVEYSLYRWVLYTRHDGFFLHYKLEW